jgi:hypothetical protein
VQAGPPHKFLLCGTVHVSSRGIAWQGVSAQCARAAALEYTSDWLCGCSYTFEYASRFPTSSKIKMNQWVSN